MLRERSGGCSGPAAGALGHRGTTTGELTIGTHPAGRDLQTPSV